MTQRSLRSTPALRSALSVWPAVALLVAATAATAATGCAAGANRSASAMAPAAMTVQAGPAAPAHEAPATTFVTPGAPPAAPVTTGFADVNTDNSLISNGSVTASSEQLLSTASGFRREVYRLGGRVFSEQVHFRTDPEDGTPSEAASATYRIKILPRLLPDVLDWLGKHSSITAQDVSSIVAMESESDAAIVRADVQARLAELDAQLADTSLVGPVRAALVEERSRLEPQAIANPDAVADNTKRVAVLELHLEAPARPDAFAHAHLLAHARGSFVGLGLLGQSDARHNRVGAGVGIGGRSPVSTLEVMAYASPEMSGSTGMTATFGVGTYSKAFGGGSRGSLNPYVGARVGYAYFEASYLAVAAEVGVELVKQKGVLWTVSARPMGLVGSSSQVAVEVGSSLGLAF